MTMPLHFVLVRHGESEGNVIRRLSHQGDHSGFTEQVKSMHSSQYRLSLCGRDQARVAGKWIKENVSIPFHRLWVSEYIRALETAALIDLPKATWFKTPFLRERNAGDLDCLSEAEKREKFAHSMLLHENDSYFWQPPSGESMVDLALRLHRFLDTLHRGHAENCVLAVCHGEVMWGFRILLERLSQNSFNQLLRSTNPFDRIHNCQILHYTRQNPHQPADIRPYTSWVRSTCPGNPDLSLNQWVEIVRPSYSNEQLLLEVEAVPHILEPNRKS